jgi:hypothetical protein
LRLLLRGSIMTFQGGCVDRLSRAPVARRS